LKKWSLGARILAPEPGIHNPDALRSIPALRLWIPGSRKSATRNDQHQDTLVYPTPYA
jgi:hypothetical protein